LRLTAKESKSYWHACGPKPGRCQVTRAVCPVILAEPGS
jgi:hypothetical protein